MGKTIDLSGNVYGKLTVVDRAPNKGRAPMWNCKCSCGNTKVVNGGSLRRGSTKSCGYTQGIAQNLHPEAGQCSVEGVRFIDGKYCALDDEGNIIEAFELISHARRIRKKYVADKAKEPEVKVEVKDVPGVKLKPNGKWSAILYTGGKAISCGTHETQKQAITAKHEKAKELGVLL